MFDGQFDESALINVRVPQYFQKLGIIMNVAKRRYEHVLCGILCILKKIIA